VKIRVSCVRFCHCCTLPRSHYAGSFYADNVYVHYVDRQVRFVLSSRPQYTFRRKSQQWFNAVGLAKVYLVCTNLISHFIVVVCAECNRIFFHYYRHRCCCRCCCYCTMHYDNDFSSWCERFYKIARFKNSFMSRTSYEPSGIVISRIVIVVLGEIKFVVWFVHIRIM